MDIRTKLKSIVIINILIGIIETLLMIPFGVFAYIYQSIKLIKNGKREAIQILAMLLGLPVSPIIMFILSLNKNIRVVNSSIKDYKKYMKTGEE